MALNRALLIGCCIVPAAPLAFAARAPALTTSYRPALALRRYSPATCSASSALPPRRIDRELLDAAMRPLRRMIAAIARVIDRIVRAWKARDSSLAAAPGAPTVVRAAALRQLREVVGSATRSFPPADEVLVYFNYELSPFYAELPPSRVLAVVEQSSGWSNRLGQSVRWLSHAQARSRNGFERASDESRLNLLRELYDEALAEEQRGRVGASPAWMAWLGGFGEGVDRTPKYGRYPSVLNVLEEEEAGEGAGEEAGQEDEDEDEDDLEALGRVLDADQQAIDRMGRRTR